MNSPVSAAAAARARVALYSALEEKYRARVSEGDVGDYIDHLLCDGRPKVLSPPLLFGLHKIVRGDFKGASVPVGLRTRIRAHLGSASVFAGPSGFLGSPFGYLDTSEQIWSQPPPPATRGLNRNNLIDRLHSALAATLALKAVKPTLREIDLLNKAIQQPHNSHADKLQGGETAVHTAFKKLQAVKLAGQPYYSFTNAQLAEDDAACVQSQTLGATDLFRVKVGALFPEEEMFFARETDELRLATLYAAGATEIARGMGDDVLAGALAVIGEESKTVEKEIKELEPAKQKQAVALMYLFPYESVESVLASMPVKLRPPPLAFRQKEFKKEYTYYIKFLMEGAANPELGFKGCLAYAKEVDADDFQPTFGFKGMMAVLNTWTQTFEAEKRELIREVCFFIRRKIMFELIFDCAIRNILHTPGLDQETACVPTYINFGSADFTSDLDTTLIGPLAELTTKHFGARLCHRTALLTGLRMSSEDFIDGSVFCANVFHMREHKVSDNSFEPLKPDWPSCNKMDVLIPDLQEDDMLKFDYDQLLFALLKVVTMTHCAELVDGIVCIDPTYVGPESAVPALFHPYDGMAGIIQSFPDSVQGTLSSHFTALWKSYNALFAEFESDKKDTVTSSQVMTMLYHELALRAADVKMSTTGPATLQLANAISASLTYNAEAYHASSTILHVLCVLQGRLPLHIRPVGFLCSIIENYANAIHVLPNALAKPLPGLPPTENSIRGLVSSSKYFQRMMDAYFRLCPSCTDPDMKAMRLCAEKLVKYVKQRKFPSHLPKYTSAHIQEVALYLLIRYLGKHFVKPTAVKKKIDERQHSTPSKMKALSRRRRRIAKKIVTSNGAEDSEKRKKTQDAVEFAKKAFPDGKLHIKPNKKGQVKFILTGGGGPKNYYNDKRTNEKLMASMMEESVKDTMESFLLTCLDEWEPDKKVKGKNSLLMRTQVLGSEAEEEDVENYVHGILAKKKDTLRVTRMKDEALNRYRVSDVRMQVNTGRKGAQFEIHLDGIMTEISPMLHLVVQKAIASFSSDTLARLVQAATRPSVCAPYDTMLQQLTAGKKANG